MFGFLNTASEKVKNLVAHANDSDFTLPDILKNLQKNHNGLGVTQTESGRTLTPKAGANARNSTEAEHELPEAGWDIDDQIEVPNADGSDHEQEHFEHKHTNKPDEATRNSFSNADSHQFHNAKDSSKAKQQPTVQATAGGWEEPDWDLNEPNHESIVDQESQTKSKEEKKFPLEKVRTSANREKLQKMLEDPVQHTSANTNNFEYIIQLQEMRDIMKYERELLNKEHRKKQQALEELEKTLNQKQNELNVRNQDLDMLAKKIEIKQHLQIDEHSLDKIVRSNSTLEQDSSRLKEDLEILKAEHSKELADVKKGNESEIEKLKQHLRDELKTQEQNYLKKLNSIETGFQRQKTELGTTHQNEIQNVTKKKDLEIKNYKGEISRVQKEREDRDAQIVRLKQSYDSEKQTMNKQREDAVKGVQQQLVEVESIVSSLKKQLNEQKSAHQSELRKLIGQHNEEVQRLQVQLSEERDNSKDLEKEVLMLSKSKKEELEDLAHEKSKEIKGLQTQIQQLNSKIQKLQKEKEQVEKTSQENKKRSTAEKAHEEKEIARLAALNQELREENLGLQALITKFKAKLGDWQNNIKDKLTDQHQKTKSVGNELDDLNESYQKDSQRLLTSVCRSESAKKTQHFNTADDETTDMKASDKLQTKKVLFGKEDKNLNDSWSKPEEPRSNRKSWGAKDIEWNFDEDVPASKQKEENKDTDNTEVTIEDTWGLDEVAVKEEDDEAVQPETASKEEKGKQEDNITVNKAETDKTSNKEEPKSSWRVDDEPVLGDDQEEQKEKEPITKTQADDQDQQKADDSEPQRDTIEDASISVNKEPADQETIESHSSDEKQEGDKKSPLLKEQEHQDTQEEIQQDQPINEVESVGRNQDEDTKITGSEDPEKVEDNLSEKTDEDQVDNISSGTADFGATPYQNLPEKTEESANENQQPDVESKQNEQSFTEDKVKDEQEKPESTDILVNKDTNNIDISDKNSYNEENLEAKEQNKQQQPEEVAPIVDQSASASSAANVIKEAESPELPDSNKYANNDKKPSGDLFKTTKKPETSLSTEIKPKVTALKPKAALSMDDDFFGSQLTQPKSTQPLVIKASKTDDKVTESKNKNFQEIHQEEVKEQDGWDVIEDDEIDVKNSPRNEDKTEPSQNETKPKESSAEKEKGWDVDVDEPIEVEEGWGVDISPMEPISSSNVPKASKEVETSTKKPEVKDEPAWGSWDTDTNSTAFNPTKSIEASSGFERSVKKSPVTAPKSSEKKSAVPDDDDLFGFLNEKPTLSKKVSERSSTNKLKTSQQGLRFSQNLTEEKKNKEGAFTPKSQTVDEDPFNTLNNKTQEGLPKKGFVINKTLISQPKFAVSQDKKVPYFATKESTPSKNDEFNLEDLLGNNLKK